MYRRARRRSSSYTIGIKALTASGSPSFHRCNSAVTVCWTDGSLIADPPASHRHQPSAFQPEDAVALSREPRIMRRDHGRQSEIAVRLAQQRVQRSEEHTSELQSRFELVCRLLLEKKNSTSKRSISATRSAWHG